MIENGNIGVFAAGPNPQYSIKEALDIAAEQMQAILDQYNAGIGR